jgi:hypothetical protein
MSIRPKATRPDMPLHFVGLRGQSAGMGNARGTKSSPPQNGPASSTKVALEGTARIAVYRKHSPLQGGRGPGLAAKPPKILLEIRLETSPQFLEQVGAFVRAYTRARFEPRTAEKTTLASYELIENAVNYGSVSGDVVYTLAETHRGLEIGVVNASPIGRLANLRAQLERIRINPEKAYLDDIAHSVNSPGGRTALGLLRICYEGQMDLEFEAEGSNVTMRAICVR